MFDSGQVFINFVDFTAMVSDPTSMSWGATRGARGDCNVPLRLFADEPYSPTIGDVIEIYDPPVGQPGALRVWIGTVEDYDIEFQDNDGLRIASLKGVTLHQMFDTQPCPQADFTDEPAENIFSFLFAAAALPIAVALGTVDSGPAITRTFDPKTNIGSAWSQLATDSNGYWDIDPRPATPTVNFIVTSIPAAPFVLHDDNILFGSNKYRQSRSDFRDVQIIEAPPGVMALMVSSFDGDGTTVDFDLPEVPNQVISAAISSSTQATVTGVFTGQPADDDTITIAGRQYKFKTVIDNEQQNQIHIGAAAANTYDNLTDAINGIPTTRGIGYSSPTTANGSVTAVVSTDLIVSAISFGAAGNGLLVSGSPANFTWEGGTTSGGSDGITTQLSFGMVAIPGFGVLWNPGSSRVTLLVPPEVGQRLVVTYSGSMSNFPTVGNNAAAGLGIGSQYQIMTARNATEYESVVRQARAVLSGRSVIPGEYRFVSDDAGYFTGDGWDVDLTEPSQLVAKVNGQPWICQDVSAEWIEGMENATVAGYGHFRYSVHFVNTMAYTPYQDTLQRLVDNPLRDLPGTELNPPTTGPGGQVRIIYWDRLVLADSTIADDVMPHVTVALPLYSESPLSYLVGKGLRCLAVLSVAITGDLTVRFNKTTMGSPVTTSSWTVTIPNGTAIDEVIRQDISEIEFFEGDVISGDVIDSDEQIISAAPWGIATFQIVWAA